MNTVNSALKWIALICAGLATIAVGFTALFFVAEVVARYGFGHPLNWAGDNGSYMLLVTTFLILPQITRQRRHIAVTILIDLIPDRRRKSLLRVMDLIVAAVLAVVTWFVIELCIRQFHQGVMTTQANQIPRWWLTSIMAAGLVLAAINFLMPPDERDSVEIEEF